VKIPRTPWLLVVAAGFWAVVQLLRLVGFNDYYLFIANLSLVYVILAVSLNLINGIIGQFSLGHMGFAAVGAYVSGSITTLIYKLSPNVAAHYPGFVLALVAGGVAAALVGVAIGFPTLRLKGDYLAIVTLGFGEIIRTIFNNIDAVGGPRGLLGIPKFSTFTVILAFALITVAVIRNIAESAHGRNMIAIRENELAADLVGIDTTGYKVKVFALGAFFAGVGGGLYAHLLQIAHPTQFGFIYSVQVLIMVYAGGVGSLTGSVLAAFALTILTQVLKSFLSWLKAATDLPIGGDWYMVVYALLLILIMLYRTEGLMGTREAKLMIIPEEDEK